MKVNQDKSNTQFSEVTEEVKKLFTDKHKDYGSSWRVLRPTSLTDQIFIKAQRIRSIQETKENKVGDSLRGEFIGILNYSIMAVIQLDGTLEGNDLTLETAQEHYVKVLGKAFDLFQKKNHDYGEAWRDMRISSMTDLILMKILRIKQIEDNDGKTLVSEGLEANYLDMVNYSAFCLIRISEGEDPMK